MSHADLPQSLRGLDRDYTNGLPSSEYLKQQWTNEEETMPHYKGGTEAKVGDFVRWIGGYIGLVTRMLPGEPLDLEVKWVDPHTLEWRGITYRDRANAFEKVLR